MSSGADSQTPISNGRLELNSTGNVQLNLNGGTIGFNVIDVAFGLLRTVRNTVTFSKVSAAFVDKYWQWKKEDYQKDIVQQLSKADSTWPYKAQDSHFWDGVLSEKIQNNILSMYEQYQFSGFREYIKTLPQYESHITQLYQRVRAEQENTPYALTKAVGLRKPPSWEAYPGYENESFPEIVTELYTNIRDQTRAREQWAHEKQLREKNK